ncbi:MAG: T9SS type A sorting domain-containing protein [Bacteroidetes bacterium]|nr:T9SS type A sorting domain-containing protein [Bacteroidota bacterium]
MLSYKNIFFLLFFVLTLSFSAKSQLTDFYLTDTEGNSHSLFTALSAGEAVILDFFFLTCGYSQWLCPALDSLYEECGSNQYDVKVFSFEIQENPLADVKAWKIQYGSTYPSFYGPDAATYWDANWYPVLGSGFEQLILLLPDTNGPASAEIKFTAVGYVNDDIPTIKQILLDSGYCNPSLIEPGISNIDIVSYPNPTTDELYIEIDLDNSQLVSVYLYNLIGENLGNAFEGKLHAGTNKISVGTAHLASGMYLLQVKTGKIIRTKRFSVIR